MEHFRDRVAVITGGAGGIGMAMARAFAERARSSSWQTSTKRRCSVRSPS
jgi:NADP-dependent 3-hydroxy acid dehydrogenase YdfG